MKIVLAIFLIVGCAVAEDEPIIPNVNLDQVPLPEAVDWLRQETGLRIDLVLSPRDHSLDLLFGHTPERPAVDDFGEGDFGGGDFEEPDPPPEEPVEPPKRVPVPSYREKVTLQLGATPRDSVLDYFAMAAALHLDRDGDRVILAARDLIAANTHTEVYPLPLSFFKGVEEGKARQSLAEAVFRAGHAFPPGSQFAYHSQSQRAVITTTQQAHTKIEKILEEFAPTPLQLRIICELVKVDRPYVENLAACRVTPQYFQAIPAKARPVLSRIAVITSGSRTARARIDTTQLDVTSTLNADSYSCELALHWQTGDSSLQTTLIVWDGESALVQLDTDHFLWIHLRALNPAGLPVRDAYPIENPEFAEFANAGLQLAAFRRHVAKDPRSAIPLFETALSATDLDPQERQRAAAALQGCRRAIDPTESMAKPTEIPPVPASEPRGIQHKLNNIIIPRVDFDEAPFSEVFEFLRLEAKRLDPAGEGANIGLLCHSRDLITINFDNIPLGEAIRYICQSGDLRYTVKDEAVLITTWDTTFDEFVTRFFYTSPGDARNPLRLFAEMGISFPRGATIARHAASGIVVATNSPDEFRKMEKVISFIDMTPTQVQIDAALLTVEPRDRQLSIRELRELPATRRQNTSRLSVIALIGQTANAKSTNTRLQVTPTVGSDGYSIDLALTWSAGDFQLATQLQVWDGETAIIPMGEQLLLINANILNPAGLPIRTANP